jgi:TolB-like protein/Tfp pilus assembly protein PilF
MADFFRERLQVSLGDGYAIERELGGGGMSRVFVARDLALGRDVVVKVLSSDVAEGLSAERFAREIKLAAALQEPHIVPLHLAGMTSDGLPYYTMPYVRGESLRARLREGTVPRAEAIAILHDIATALEYAHANGVVHRDIKPENVLLAGRTAVVTDFGIAKALHQAGTRAVETQLTFTQKGVSVGTPAYMAPEQIAADPNTDQRADLYAWGVIAYELFAGHHPFEGRKTPQQLLAAQMSETPDSLADPKFGLSPGLSAVVMQCLSKDPEMRPASASVLLSVLDGDGTGRHSVVPGRRVLFWVVAGSIAATVAIVVTVVAVRHRATMALARESATALAAESPGTVAVLPFENTGGDPKDEYFSEGMTDELAHALARLPSLRVAARTSSYAFKGKHPTLEDIGRALRVASVVTGTVQRSGARLRVSAELARTSDGQRIWGETYESQATDVFEVQDQFTKAIVIALAPALEGAATTVSAESRGTTNRTAYDLYLKGRYFWNKRTLDGVDRSTEYFKQAIALDSTYAMAYAGLADSYTVTGAFNYREPRRMFALARPPAVRALALDSGLAEAHASMGIIDLFADLDAAAAKRELGKAIAIDPRYATAHLFNAWAELIGGDASAAVREVRTAEQLDPLSLIINTRVGTMLVFARRYDEAERQFRKTLEIDSTFPPAYYELAVLQAVRGEYAASIATARHAVELGHSDALSIAAYSLGRSGRRAEAITILHDFEAHAANEWVSPSSIALIYLGLGDRSAATRWLAKARETRDLETGLIQIDPLYDSLRRP